MATPQGDVCVTAAGVRTVKLGLSSLPAWLTGVPLNKWIEIQGTKAVGSGLVPGEDANDFWAPSAHALRAYSGGLLREDTCEYFVALSGGHGDSRENFVGSVDLTQNSPSWTLRNPSSSVANQITEQPYYLDGKPASRHSYWSTQWIPQVNRIMVHGTRWAGASSFPNSNGFNPTTNTWDAAGTWASCVSSGSVGLALCKETATGACWAIVGSSLYRWTPLGNTWTLTQTFPSAEYLAPPLVHDPVRNHLFQMAWGDGQASGTAQMYARRISAVGTVRESVTFNASAAFSDYIATAPAYTALEYDVANDCYCLYAQTAGATQKIYIIRPNSSLVWDMELLTIASGSATPLSQFAYNKFRYVPRWKGFVLLADPFQNLLFIRTAV